MNNISKIIDEIIHKYKLDSLDIGNPRELVFMLLASIKNCTIFDIKLSKVDINELDLLKLEDEVKRIAIDKIPPQYITHKVNIYNETYFVNNNVLIPRQDTETLIENAINKINKYKYLKLLDMCTGSGAIGISIAKNSEIQDVTLLDISKDAIEVAEKNIKLNNVDKKIDTIVSDMFEKLYAINNKYDIITVNPPYLTDLEMSEISEFVRKEPENALLGGMDGLDFYRVIYEDAKKFLNNQGCIIVEIGCSQVKSVTDIISKYNCYYDIQVIKDMNSKDRVVICHFQNK